MDLELGLLQHRKFPEKRSLDFSETELTLGLPGLKNCGERESKAEKEQESVAAGEGGLRRKRSRSQMTQQQQQESSSSSSSTLLSPSPPPMESPPPCKARAVGWPPVREFRRARTSSYSLKTEEEDDELKGIVGGLFVKVSMDGAPYLRKLDLHLHKSYQDLTIALQRMFCCTVTIHSQDDHHHLSLQQTFSNPSSFVATYQDRDGDWMLVGDVPWEMFTHSCKRLRIVKASEAIGLAPQSQESHKGQMTSNGKRHMGCGL